MLNFPFLQSFHVTIGTGKEWRVVCYGSYSDIYVVDALSLEVDICVAKEYFLGFSHNSMIKLNFYFEG